jgi:hypothetical protein
MSTYQPPGGQPAEGPAAYPQPQDPWAGEHGIASVPTDPIPQQYGTFGQSEVWSQATVAHGGQYDYVQQQPQRSRAGMIIGIFLGVLLLGGGGGFAAWYIVTHKGDNPTPSTSTSAPVVTTTKPGFDPAAVAVGTCLINKNATGSPDISVVACNTPGSYKILKISKGETLPEGTDGKLGAGTATTECAGLAYNRWYAYDDSDNTKDIFFCLKDN